MKTEICNKTERNYELDFLKLFFSVLVFIYHSESLVSDNDISFPPDLGAISVHFFFVVSGMLMVKSISKKNFDTENAAKSAMDFVIHKFKLIAPQYFSALLIGFVAYSIIYKQPLFEHIAELFPEVFPLYASGIWRNNNAATWYLSAMFICMLPLAYLLIKKRDFTRHLLAPLLSVALLGYMCQINDYSMISHTKLNGIVMGGFIRGICGLCFGICAYNLYELICKIAVNRNMKVLLTITEILIYILFFGSWFVVKSGKAVMSCLLGLPIAIAITFSGKSYVGHIFRFQWMKVFAPVSLHVYLTNNIAQRIVEKTFEKKNTLNKLLIMIHLTILFCILIYLMVKLEILIWKKVKPIFINTKKAEE